MKEWTDIEDNWCSGLPRSWWYFWHVL